MLGGAEELRSDGFAIPSLEAKVRKPFQMLLQGHSRHSL